jgi:hypothetical protein
LVRYPTACKYSSLGSGNGLTFSGNVMAAKLAAGATINQFNLLAYSLIFKVSEHPKYKHVFLIKY